jgi:CRISPR-associated protein Cas4
MNLSLYFEALRTTMADDEVFVLISALQHYAYCPRQCALIHIEKVWDENLYTLRGLRVHETVNTPSDELIEGVRVERAMPLWSHQLGLTGVGDVVEFLADGTPYPVEYKSGSRKVRVADSIQLCAQTLCLEEMLNCKVPQGAIFHHASRRRQKVCDRKPDKLSKVCDLCFQLQNYHLLLPISAAPIVLRGTHSVAPGLRAWRGLELGLPIIFRGCSIALSMDGYTEILSVLCHRERSAMTLALLS